MSIIKIPMSGSSIDVFDELKHINDISVNGISIDRIGVMNINTFNNLNQGGQQNYYCPTCRKPYIYPGSIYNWKTGEEPYCTCGGKK